MKTLAQIKKEGFEGMINQVVNADCFDILKLIPDKAVDLVLTDFPYGVNYEYDIYQDTEENLRNLIGKVMPEILRISKRALVTCGHTNIQKFPQINWIMGWFYGTTNARNSWGFTSWQPILVYGKDPYLENGMGARMDVIKDAHAPESWIKTEHGCPKPIQFWTKLLVRGSIKETDIILDPFLGSGTTAVACKQLGRRFIGVEISEKYCKIAEDRLRQDILF